MEKPVFRRSLVCALVHVAAGAEAPDLVAASAARFKRLRKNSFVRLRFPSAAKAGADFVMLTARLKPRPFTTKSKSDFFPQPVKPCPSTRSLNSSSLLPIDSARAGFAAVLTVDQYAASIVEKYRVIPDTNSTTHHAADRVIPLIKQWGKQHLLGLTLSGAYAKNTAISLSSDVDVLVALGMIPGMEMKSIFWSLFEYLSDRELNPHTRNVSIRLRSQGLNVDLIPACREPETSGNALFNKRSGKTVRTDIARHVHLVANSGRQQEICAFKIWRERMSLDFPSLYLECTVLRALGTERYGQLADNVLTVLRYLSRRFEQAVVSDPANPDNLLSNDLSAADKTVIATAARDALYDENWKKIHW
jgi:hypothetical protein